MSSDEQKPEVNGYWTSVKNFSSSAATSINNATTSAWNSEFAASTSATVKDFSTSATKSIGEAATSAWNSETASTATSAISEAAKNARSWYDSSSEENEELEPSGHGFRGGIAALSRNASHYVISTVGRSSNILNIFDKTNKSSLGNPRWWIRFDRPHGNVDFHHININKAVTGLKDPHIPLTPTTAKTIGVLGKVAEKANDVAPLLTTAAMIYEAYRVGQEVHKDMNHGTTRNTIKTLAATSGTYSSGSIGAYAGSVIGTSIFPGLGTIFGAVVGGIVGGHFGGHYSHVATENALNHVKWDVVTFVCDGCDEEYTWKKYQEIEGTCCTRFNNKRQDSVDYWFKKLETNHDF